MKTKEKEMKLIQMTVNRKHRKPEKKQPDIMKMSEVERKKYMEELDEIDSSCIVKKYEEKFRD